MQPKLVPVSLSGEAQADADAFAAVDWYIGEGALLAADDFADAIEKALDLLSQFPELGETCVHSMRTLPLIRFPYSLFYRLQDEVIRVIAVAHHSRRPGYWVGRR